MKVATVFTFLFLSANAFADAGFYYQSKPVLTYADGAALFDALKAANESDDEVDVCYNGDFSAAISATENKTGGAIVFNLIDVYGEGDYPALDLEFANDKEESAYGIIHSCN